MVREIKLDLKVGFQSLDVSSRDVVKTVHLGRYKSTFKGRGLEFDSYRKYDQNNDDASMIDQLASARAGDLMVRQFTEERNMDVFFLIDVSNTMILTSQQKLKCEYVAELVSALSFIILKSDDNVGFSLFSDEIKKTILPKGGLKSHYYLINTLSKAENYGGGYNLTIALNNALEVLTEGALVIVVSDFIGLEEGWQQAVRNASSKFSVIGLMVRDPIDRKIPLGMGQIAIADPLSKDSILVDPNYVKPFYEEHVRREEAEIKSVFNEVNSEFTILQTDEGFIEKIIELFSVREQKWH